MPLTTRSGTYDFPIFLPVYQPQSNLVSMDAIANELGFRGLIMNGFFMYKNAEVKAKLLGEATVKEHVGFDGLVMTDSGAFQGLKRPLYLSNKKIVKFQDQIGADIISPLDLITPPGDNFPTAEQKMNATHKRIKQALEITEHSILAGVQQGGRFLELRKRSMDALMEMQVQYVAIGSLVPFFNRRHDMKFIIPVMRNVAAVLEGTDMPVHIYGAGDPVELPFLFALGANIFDSSSYGHYAQQGWYMTRYGALNAAQEHLIPEYGCTCVACTGEEGVEGILDDAPRLARHNLETIKATMQTIREQSAAGTLEAHLAHVLDQHQQWFPDSLLKSSWEEGF
ncbi:MAG: tRNA-guanine transglycosylase [Bacteroidota bacterium]